MDRRQALRAALGVCGGTAGRGVLGALALSCEDTASRSDGLAQRGGKANGLEGAVATEEGRSPAFSSPLFGAELAMALEDLTEWLLPETDTPGAKSAGVATRIEVQLREVLEPEQTSAFVAGLKTLVDRAKEIYGVAFHQCDNEAQSSLLAEVAGGAIQSNGWNSDAPGSSSFYETLRGLTIRQFCESKLGATRVLQYESVPGAYRGCVPLKSIGRAWATH